MNILTKFLYRQRVLDFSPEKLRRWQGKGRVNDLLFVLRMGEFNIRILAISLLEGHLDNVLVKKQLIRSVADEVKIVSVAAINALNPVMTSELQIYIDSVQAKRVERRTSMTSEIHLDGRNISSIYKEKPSNRLKSQLRQQQSAMHPPFGF